MGRISTKANKTPFQLAREELGLSREKAAEVTGIEPFKIERIENEKIQADPWDVKTMAEAYREPQLCNYYCANECPLGINKVPELKVKGLAQVVLEVLASLNCMKKSQEKLIEITADGVIDNEELNDFIFIQDELKRISVTIESLKLWTEEMLAEGKIDTKKYNELIKKK